MLDRKSFLADASEGFTASTINFSSWANVGADALVKTQLSADGGTCAATCGSSPSPAARKSSRLVHVEPVDSPRRLAHMLANALYKHFTREPGPFETHLAFVRKTQAGQGRLLSVTGTASARCPSPRASINLLPAVGPQGDSVAFTCYRKGKPDLYVAAGRAARRRRW